MATDVKVNYVKQYKTHFIEFDSNSTYIIVEVDSAEFDKYWNTKAHLNENFEKAFNCKRMNTYADIVKEIQTNPNHEIAYPIISWVNEKNIKMSQGRHRIRAIIDAGAMTLQIAVKKEFFDTLKNQINVKVVNEFVF